MFLGKNKEILNVKLRIITKIFDIGPKLAIFRTLITIFSDCQKGLRIIVLLSTT